jgi:very-short-patch-repair endonuclease
MHPADLFAKLWPLFAGLLLVAVLLAVVKGKAQPGAKEPPTARKPLTEREQAMFFRLQEAMPSHVVLAQTAFSALLDAKTTATRNTFDRKVADFVICTKAFDVVAVVELDDASHKGKKTKDALRDRMLMQVGYKALRFKNVPDVAEVHTAFARLTARQEPSA